MANNKKKKKRIPSMQTTNARFNVTSNGNDYTITVFGNDISGKLKNTYKIHMNFYEIFKLKEVINAVLEKKLEYIKIETDQLADAAEDLQNLAARYAHPTK